MKQQIKYFFIFICMTNAHLFGQTVFSNGTGGGYWNSSSTWLGGNVPSTGNDVVIAGSDSVYTGAEAVCNSLTVLSGGKFATSVDSVQVITSVTLEDNAYFYNQVSKPELPGNEFYLDPNSYVVHIGSGTVGGTKNYEFGNLILRRGSGTTAAADLIINGNLILENVSNGNGFRLVDVNGGTRMGTVKGNVIINKGLFVCIDIGASDAVGIWNIEGDVYVNTSNSRMGPFSSAGANGLGVFNIGGSLIVNGGRIQASSSSTHSTGTAIYNIGGDFIMNEGSQVRTNHDGPLAINFVGTSMQTVRFRGSDNFNVGDGQNPIIFNDTIKIGSNVVFDLDTIEWRPASLRGGNFIVEGTLEMKDSSRLSGTQSFLLKPTSTLKIGSPLGISSSGLSGNIQMSGTLEFNEDANYEYKGTSSQLLGDGLPSTVNGLTINNPSGIVLDKNLTVNGSLKTLNGDLDLNGNVITLGSDATLSETPNNIIVGSAGKLTITKDVSAPSGLNVGGLGAMITSTVSIGSTTIERTHAPGTGQGNQGIKRVFNIIPTNNSGLNATLRFYYDESELNNIPENELIFFKSPDGTNNSWFSMGGIVNSTENYVEVSGLNDFSYWTLAGTNTPLPVEDDKNIDFPNQFALLQNYPNPFNPSTIIKYEVPLQSKIVIKIYDMLGNEITTLVNEIKDAGRYQVQFDGNRLSSGVYFYQIIGEKFLQTKRMILIK